MVSLDGTPVGGNVIADLDLAVDSSGDPVVALLERNRPIFGYSLTIRRLVAGTFVLDGPGDTSRASEVRIAVRPDNTVVALIARSIEPFALASIALTGNPRPGAIRSHTCAHVARSCT